MTLLVVLNSTVCVKDRLTGFEGQSTQPRALPPDIADFPGVIALFLENQYYPTHEAYLSALARQ